MIKLNFQQPTKKVLLLAISTIFGTFFIAWLFVAVWGESFPSFFGIWDKWDTPHFLNIAQNGYQNLGEARLLIAFPPFYPFLIKAFSFVFKDYLLSSLIVSNLAYIFILFVFYKLISMDYPKKTAWRALFYLSIFPTAYFLHAGYAESVFFLLAISALYLARKGKWLYASAFGALLSLTKVNGIILIPVLLFEYLWQKKFKFENIKKDVFFLILAPLGFAYYLLINYSVFGNALEFMNAQAAGWSRSLAWPWTGFIESLTLNDFSWLNPSAVIVTGAEILFASLGFFLIIYGAKFIRPSYTLYSLLSWLLIVSNSHWMSIPRHTILFFPIFITLAVIGRKKHWDYLITFFSLLFYSFFLFRFISWGWAF